MTEILSLVANLRRPSLLIRAARFGMIEYNRNRDLKRLMKTPVALPPDRALPALMAEEERLEETRKSGDAAYSLNRHVDILIAMMSEVRLLPKPPQNV